MNRRFSAVSHTRPQFAFFAFNTNKRGITLDYGRDLLLCSPTEMC